MDRWLAEEKQKVNRTTADKFRKLDEQYRHLTSKLDTTSKEFDKVFELMMELEEKIGGN